MKTQICPTCGRVYVDTGFRCLVHHPDGHCCHYGSKDLASGEYIGSDNRTLSERQVHHRQLLEQALAAGLDEPARYHAALDLLSKGMRVSSEVWDHKKGSFLQIAGELLPVQEL